ncbi:MAG: penicillin acylase family protein [Acidobacteria bacterium]|nr:penicillin acylase family protein [Acidobacteriota bacterium]
MKPLLAAAVAAALLLLASGPSLLGARAAADRAEIRRDTFGIPHILAEDEEAAGFAFGYAMAEDHASEIGRRYLQARGEAARHFGAAHADSDLAMRRLDNRAAARRALADETGRRFRRWLQGFAAGVNQYVTERRDALPAWMPTVEASDPLAYGRMFGILAALRPPADLIAKYAPAAVAPAPAEGLPADAPGSNAVALGAAKTTSGRPILLGNPHLSWSSLYWEAHVTIPGRVNFYGSTLVGIPVLRAGFNDRLGYVQTNNDPDLEDIYALPLASGRTDAFVHGGRVRSFERRRVAVEVLQPDGSVFVDAREYEETPLGPVIYRTDDRVFVVRSMNLEWWRQYEGFYELMQAESLEAFRSILGRRLTMTSNYTYADVEGNILYAWNARLPRRPDPAFDYSLDVPADTRRLFWRGVHRLRDLPSLLNPPGGYIQNANNPPWWTTLRASITPERYPSYIERGELSLRAQAVLETVDAAGVLSPGDLLTLKFSSRMRMADRLIPELRATAQQVDASTEALRAGVETLAAWDRQARADSRGAVLFDRWLSLHPDPFATPWSPAEPMTTPRGLADRAAAVAALERAVADVRQQYNSERVAWGDVHRFRMGDIDLPGDGAPGRYGVFRVLAFEQAADGARVAGRRSPDEPLAGFGDAWILLVHFTRPVTAWSVLAYGQTTDLASPHSRDQIRLFAEHRLRPVWFSDEAIAANLERRYRPGASTVVTTR